MSKGNTNRYATNRQRAIAKLQIEGRHINETASLRDVAQAIRVHTKGRYSRSLNNPELLEQFLGISRPTKCGLVPPRTPTPWKPLTLAKTFMDQVAKALEYKQIPSHYRY